MSLYNKLRTKASDVVYRNVFYRLGMGRPVAREAWEDSYSRNYWNYIEEETARYQTIQRFYQQFNPGASVLDVGCGRGGLFNYLKKENRNLQYMGIDISAHAVKVATSRYPGAVFKQMDFDETSFEKKFDIVIFNEVIEFFKRPVKTLEKCSNLNLHPSGGIIISMFQGHDALWDQVDKRHNIVAEEEVQNEQGKKWRIKLLTPRD